VWKTKGLEPKEWKRYQQKLDHLMIQINHDKSRHPQEVYDDMCKLFSEAATDCIPGHRQEDPPKRQKLPDHKQQTIKRVKELKKERKRLRKQMNRKRAKQEQADPDLEESLRKICEMVKEVENVGKEEDISIKSYEMLGGKNRNKVYDFIERMQKEDVGEVTMRDKEGNIITDNAVLVEEMSEFIKSVYQWKHFPEAEAKWGENAPKIGRYPKATEPFRIREMEKVLYKMEVTNKSPGCTNIPPAFLKHMGPIAIITVMWWCQLMWDKEITPDQIGISHITMLYKANKKSDIRNYRTLSVGCNLCKIYLKMLEFRIRDVVEKFGILNEYQCGFRENRRCQDNLLVLDTIIEDSKTNKTPLYVALLDITKAYDKVDRKILWEKLKQMNFPDKIIRILEESYRNPRGKAKFQGAETDYIPMPIGLKQGCVLSPILFAIYISDLLFELQKSKLGPLLKWDVNGILGQGVEPKPERLIGVRVPCMAFADDLMVLGNAEELQKLLDIIAKYAARNKLEFAGHKSMVIPIQRKPNPKRFWKLGTIWEKPGTPGRVNLIKEVSEARYLGLFLRRTIPRYRPHFNKSVARANQIAATIRIVAHQTSHPAYYGGIMWQTYAIPKITFAYDVACVPHGLINKLDLIQRDLMTSLTGLPAKTAVAVLYAETGTKPIMFHLMQATAAFYSYAMSLPHYRLVKCAIMHQIYHFQSKGWNVFKDDRNNEELWAKKEFKASKYWLKWLTECTEALQIPITKCFSQPWLKDRATEQWEWTFCDIVENMPSLQFYQDRKLAPWVDINYMPKTSMKWWLKARAGKALEPQTKYVWCDCNGKNNKVTLEHLMKECRVTDEIVSHWFNDKEPLIRRTGWKRQTEVKDILSIFHPPKIRILVGDLIRRIVQKWMKIQFTEGAGKARPARVPTKSDYQMPLDTWKWGNRMGTKPIEGRDESKLKEMDPFILFRFFRDIIPVLPQECDKIFIKMVPGVEGRYRDEEGGWERNVRPEWIHRPPKKPPEWGEEGGSFP
jgi:hypothetical protein